MAPRGTSTFSVSWTWSAVFAGVLTSLILQLLFSFLGIGVGLLAVDVPTANSAPAAIGWSAFAWWAMIGVISAFVGGAVAAALSPDDTQIGRIGHSLAAWALATLIVAGASGIGAGTVGNAAATMGGPAYNAAHRMQYYAGRPNNTTTGQASASVSAPTRAQVEEARKHFAFIMLASFLALVCGAGAAYGAGATMDPRTTRKVADTVA
jgi:hypothetical protein